MSSEFFHSLFSLQPCTPGPLPLPCAVYFGLAAIFACPIVFLIFLCCHKSEETKALEKAARQRGPITESPVVPAWLLEERRHFHNVKILHGFRMESRVDIAQRIKQGKPHHQNYVPFVLSAYRWLDFYIECRYGKTELPLDLCLLSVPMPGFQCVLDSPTDFEPSESESGAVERDGHLIYQMLGDESFQISYYVTGEKVVVAGYCIYISEPRGLAECYYKKHIEEFIVPELPRKEEKKDIKDIFIVA